jgi:hypothetical protein
VRPRPRLDARGRLAAPSPGLGQAHAAPSSGSPVMAAPIRHGRAWVPPASGLVRSPRRLARVAPSAPPQRLRGHKTAAPAALAARARTSRSRSRRCERGPAASTARSPGRGLAGRPAFLTLGRGPGKQAMAARAAASPGAGTAALAPVLEPTTR